MNGARRLPGPFLLGAGASLAAGLFIAANMALPARERPAPPKSKAAPGPAIVRLDPPANRPRSAPENSLETARFRDAKPPETSARDGVTETASISPPALDTSSVPGDRPAADTPAPRAFPSPSKREHQDRDRKDAGPTAVEAFAVADLGEVDPGRAELSAMVGRPGVRRIIVVADVIDARTIEAFDDTVKDARLKRPRQVRVEIGQGVVVDPEHPEGRGVIYAMAMDDAERKALHAALEANVANGRIVEDVPPAAVTTRLARGEVGTIRLNEGEAAAGLIPGAHRVGNDLAMKAEQLNANEPRPLASKSAMGRDKAAQPRGVAAPDDLAKNGLAQEKAYHKGDGRAENDPRLAGIGRRSATGGDEGPEAIEPAPAQAPAASYAKDQGAGQQRQAREPDTVLVWLVARGPK